MKLFKLCSVLCVTLCIVGLGINLHVSASTGLEEKNRKVEEYVQQVQEHNEEVSLLNLEDIPATIMHIPQELRIRSRGTERHSASN